MTTLTNVGGADDGIDGSTSSSNKNGINGSNDSLIARNSATPEGNGIFGFTKVPDGAGVFGLHDSNGVGVVGFGHPTGIGVVGISAPIGDKGGDGVLGVSNSEHRNGIVGRNESTTARSAQDAGGNGVLGFTQVPDGAGVLGLHPSSGVGVAGLGAIGVTGSSLAGVGVLGLSAPTGAKGGDGVQGVTNSELKNGVVGINESTTARSSPGPGGNGLFGYTQVPDGAGVLGVHGSSGHGIFGSGGVGVRGVGDNVGVWGEAKGNAWAGYFVGSVRVGGTLVVANNLAVLNADCAEEFDTLGDQLLTPGTVVVICDEGSIRASDSTYDKRVAGVVSGAGDYKPGIVLDKRADRGKRSPIALLGKVFCKVDATSSPIDIGDLLTTSDVPGYAMKATDPMKSFGSVIGKALRPIGTGQGLIPILVALQ